MCLRYKGGARGSQVRRYQPARSILLVSCKPLKMSPMSSVVSTAGTYGRGASPYGLW